MVLTLDEHHMVNQYEVDRNVENKDQTLGQGSGKLKTETCESWHELL